VHAVTKKIGGSSQTLSSRRRCRCILQYLFAIHLFGQPLANDYNETP